MSECSAVVRLQVAHPVPAFFFLIFLKIVFSGGPTDSCWYRDFKKIESSKRNLRFPFKKKTGESETIFAAFFSSPGAGRQKGGQNAYIEKGQGTGKRTWTHQARTLSKGAFGRRSDFSA